MGLDLIPLGRPKPGSELEWQSLMERLYGYQETDEPPRNTQRRLEISVPSYEAVGAPRVGQDPAADKWLLDKIKDRSGKSEQTILADYAGYCVLELLTGKCAGTPAYSNGGLYDGVDLTSFRGALLNDCADLLDRQTRDRTWTFCMRPEEAAEFGRHLIEQAASPTVAQGQNRSPFGRLFGSKPSKISSDEQRKIVEAAGRWYIFWGERGHPIWANF